MTENKPTRPQNAPLRTPVQQTGAPQQRPVQGVRPVQGTRPIQGQAVRRVPAGATRTVPQGTRPVQRPAAQRPQPQRPTGVDMNPKTVGVIAMIALFCGLLLGAMFFGGTSKPVQQGLIGVVKNTDITQPLRRCGLIDKGQACVLYIVNHTRYDKTVEDYFKQAQDLTGVPLYSIQMANPRYAKRIVRPGYFAEIHIPRVR